MKWSNYALAIVASLTIAISAYSTATIISSITPTAVISVPSDKGVKGGGFVVKLPANLSSHQAQLLNMAYQIAKEDGHSQPQLLQGILLQETKAGAMNSYKVAGQEYGLKTNERYYGIFQIKLDAARDVLSKYPSLWKDFHFQTKTDEEVIAKLIENEKFNTSVASKYLLLLRQYGYRTIEQLSAAYNQGAGGAKKVDPHTFHYSVGVVKNIQSLKKS